jgi:exosortase
MVASGVLQAIARLAAFDAAAEYGLILGLAGLVLSFLGRRAAAAMTAAFVYLIFAVFLPHLFRTALSQKMQLLSSTLGVLPLDWLDIPVFQEGNMIDRAYKLQVVEACDGLRYLFPLMSFGYLIALLFEGSRWKRMVLSSRPCPSPSA